METSKRLLADPLSARLQQARAETNYKTQGPRVFLEQVFPHLGIDERALTGATKALTRLGLASGA